jgi:hypothetical protein
VRHTQSRFLVPLVRPFSSRQSLRGWWGGMVGREGQQQHRATTPTPQLAAFPHPLRSAFVHLSQCRRGAGGETQRRRRQTTQRQGTTEQDNKRDNDKQTGTKQTDRQTISKGRAGRNEHAENSSTANDSGREGGGGRQGRAVTDTPLGVYCTRRKVRHRPPPVWCADHIFTRLA